MTDRARGFLWIAVAYVASLAGGAAWIAYRSGDAGLWTSFEADVVGTLVIFGFSRLLNNTSVYDAYWSVAPMAIVAWWAWVFDGDPIRTALVVALVWFWGVRLTWNWATGWPGLHHEDWRYVDFRGLGAGYWPLSLFGLHLFPTVQVFLGLLPAWLALRSDAPLGPLDAVAALVTFGAVVIEGLSDLQLRAFVRRGAGGICDEGLWRWSRHPNYFGEVSFWLGLALFGAATEPTVWWGWSGFVAILVMFWFVSIPMLDKRSLERRDGYAEHMGRVSRLVPWFRAST